MNAEKLDLLREAGTSFAIRKSYIQGNGGTQPVENSVSLLRDASGNSLFAATVRPLPSSSSIGPALAMKMARLLLRERVTRQLAGLDWHEDDLGLLLAAYVLETEGAPAWAANLSDIAGGDRRLNLLRIWELVHEGALVIDGKAVTLEKASIRLSTTNMTLLEHHLAEIADDRAS